jgi:hypothetical protein
MVYCKILHTSQASNIISRARLLGVKYHYLLEGKDISGMYASMAANGDLYVSDYVIPGSAELTHAAFWNRVIGRLDRLDAAARLDPNTGKELDKTPYSLVHYRVTHLHETEGALKRAMDAGIEIAVVGDVQFGSYVSLRRETGIVTVTPEMLIAQGLNIEVSFRKFWDEVLPPGILDPNTGKELDKTPYSLVHAPFVASMARNLQLGIKNGRKRDDWKKMEWNPEVRAQYMDALLRHTLEGFDAAAIACNAMIIAYHDGRQKEHGINTGTEAGPGIETGSGTVGGEGR